MSKTNYDPRLVDPHDLCAGKHQGVETSVAAYERVRDHIAECQQAILNLLREAGPDGITCKEAAAILGRDMAGISPRFTELRLEFDPPLAERLDGKNGRRKLRRDGCYVITLPKFAYPEKGESSPEKHHLVPAGAVAPATLEEALAESLGQSDWQL